VSSKRCLSLHSACFFLPGTLLLWLSHMPVNFVVFFFVTILLGLSWGPLLGPSELVFPWVFVHYPLEWRFGVPTPGVFDVMAICPGTHTRRLIFEILHLWVFSV